MRRSGNTFAKTLFARGWFSRLKIGHSKARSNQSMCCRRVIAPKKLWRRLLSTAEIIKQALEIKRLYNARAPIITSA